MPRFFDPQNLTAEQQARWDWAMAEYQQVMERNAERQLANMSENEKLEFVALAPGLNDPAKDLDTNVRNAIQQLSFLSGGSAGDAKSALFARLLSGKPALPEPPPTSFSYPWYAVIEEPGPHHVMLGGAQSMGSAMNGTRGATGKFAIGINQCSWAVVSINAAAQRLFDLQEILGQTAKPEKEGSIHHLYQWTDALLADVLAAYADNPEIIVRHGSWPEYRLALGRMESNGQRRYMERHVTPERLERTGSVFDAPSLNLNLVIGEATSRGKHPKDRLEQAKARLDSLQASAFPGLDRLMVEQQMASLEKDVAEFERDPDGWDFVKVSYDDWFLEATA